MATYIVCTCCELEKPEEDFRRDPRYKSGRIGTCATCRKEQRHKARAKVALKPCEIEECGRPQMARGLCSMHYSRIREGKEIGPANSTRTKISGNCIEDGCGGQVYCQRRCSIHYRIWAAKNRGQCRADGCKNFSASKRGYCNNHLAKLRRYGDPMGRPPRKTGKGTACYVANCGKPCIGRGLCAVHYTRLIAHGATDGCSNRTKLARTRRETGRVDDHGYRWVHCPGHSEATKQGAWALEHRKVMADYLGRPLRKNENVHHKNGKKTDNRVVNLELWVKTQPCGQRPKDLVEYAKEIIATYGDEVIGT